MVQLRRWLSGMRKHSHDRIGRQLRCKAKQTKKNWNQIKNGWFHNFFGVQRSAERVKVKELEERTVHETVWVCFAWRLIDISKKWLKINKFTSNRCDLVYYETSPPTNSSCLNWNLITVCFFLSPFVWALKSKHTHSSMYLADLDSCFVCAHKIRFSVHDSEQAIT